MLTKPVSASGNSSKALPPIIVKLVIPKFARVYYLAGKSSFS